MKYLKMIQQPDDDEDVFIRRGRMLLEEVKEDPNNLFKMASGVYWLLAPVPPSVTQHPEPDDLDLTFEASLYFALYIRNR